MLCLVFTSNCSFTVKVAPASKSTGSANVNTAAWFLPNCGSTAQPVFGLSSSDDAMESPAWFCSKSATAFTSATGFASLLPRGAAVTRILLSAKFSGRRSSLANWLTDVEHGAGALVARVAVNRLWQHHFGRGLVATPDDFGRTGALPSHPELLDWLAGELVRGGWQLKPIHRLIMESAAYRAGGEKYLVISDKSAKAATGRTEQAATPNTDSLTTNSFLSRAPRRLEGEALRDAMLAVSGQLDPTMFGPGTKDERSRRRSIYFTMKRSQLIGSMVVFDQPEPLVSQGARPTTTVAPQALLLMNGPQVREWAEAFASRVVAEVAGGEVPAQINRAYLLALSRPATAKEQGSAAAFLAAQTASYEAEKKSNASQLALADFCQVLFGLNEFAYEN